MKTKSVNEIHYIDHPNFQSDAKLHDVHHVQPPCEAIETAPDMSDDRTSPGGVAYDIFEPAQEVKRRTLQKTTETKQGPLKAKV